jgi:hypothetical protein
MSDPIDTIAGKVSEYNVFNYLVPGAVFMVGLRYVVGAIPFEHSVTFFLVTAYAVGMALSRIGSLVVEPILLRIGLIENFDFEKFVRAEKNDSKLTTLLLESNAYRTMSAVFATLLFAKGAVALQSRCSHLDQLAVWGCSIALVLLFAFSHRKMRQYIDRRVAARKEPPQNSPAAVPDPAFASVAAEFEVLGESSRSPNATQQPPKA